MQSPGTWSISVAIFLPASPDTPPIPFSAVTKKASVKQRKGKGWGSWFQIAANTGGKNLWQSHL